MQTLTIRTPFMGDTSNSICESFLLGIVSTLSCQGFDFPSHEFIQGEDGLLSIKLSRPLYGYEVNRDPYQKRMVKR